MRIQHTSDPPNAETDLGALDAGHTPIDAFYARCNFPIPRLDAATWRLELSGAFDQPRSWTMEELHALPHIERTITMECAGNGRTLMTPIPPGTPWGLGAVGTARFEGIWLADVLARSGLHASTTELVFRGADHGEVEPDGEIPYEFNLDAALAREDGPMLAWSMAGTPLRAEHGFPLRLVVPGHYGMRSVKWLTRISAIDHPFAGHFPRKYRYRGERGVAEQTPVGPIRVRSLFTSPADRAQLDAGPTTLRGIAWSGEGAITGVEIEVDGQWMPAHIGKPIDGTGHVAWTFEWTAPGAGTHALAVRATDAAGHRQPPSAVWNEGGYGNNAVHRISVTVGIG